MSKDIVLVVQAPSDCIKEVSDVLGIVFQGTRFRVAVLPIELKLLSKKDIMALLDAVSK